MKSNLAYQQEIPEEHVSRPQLVKRCRTHLNQNGYPDGEVLLLRYSVSGEAFAGQQSRPASAGVNVDKIDLDPQDQGLDVCKGLLSAICVGAVIVALILASIVALSVGHG
jgi:hypothetical protein